MKAHLQTQETKTEAEAIQHPEDMYEVFASAEQVTRRISELASFVIEKYNENKPIFVCLLNGGAPFTMRLMGEIDAQDPTFYPEQEYLTVSTYGVGRRPGEPVIEHDVKEGTDFNGRGAVILDDVLDTGITAAYVRDHLLNKGATNVDLITLVDKEVERTAYEAPLISGFHAPNKWLVGMGMDNKAVAPEAGRWMNYIAIAP